MKSVILAGLPPTVSYDDVCKAQVEWHSEYCIEKKIRYVFRLGSISVIVNPVTVPQFVFQFIHERVSYLSCVTDAKRNRFLANSGYSSTAFVPPALPAPS